MAKRINCRADYVFQVDLEVPALATGDLGAPALGAVTDLKFRLSATGTGAALHAGVDAIAASERSSDPGRFYAAVDATLLTSHVLTLGAGVSFYGIWSKAGDFDLEAVRFLVGDGAAVT